MDASSPHLQHTIDVSLPVEVFGVISDEAPPEIPQALMIELAPVIRALQKRYPLQGSHPRSDQLEKLRQAFLTVPSEKWKRATTRFLRESEWWGPTHHIAWEGLIESIIHTPTARTAEVKRPAVQKEKKLQPPSREYLLLLSHIQKHAPSKIYELVFTTIHAYCFNKLSKKGRKVYPYGQAHIIRQILNQPGLSPEEAHNAGRSILRAWAWLAKRGFINKAWNENRDEHKCAGWFVCTSLKQVGWYRDPKNRRQKTKPQL